MELTFNCHEHRNATRIKGTAVRMNAGGVFIMQSELSVLLVLILPLPFTYFVAIDTLLMRIGQLLEALIA